MMITVFTPTYNRAQLLKRAYHSLLSQTNLDFEWIIVDDGSTDNTRNVIDDIKSTHTAPFQIIYIYKENGGKHTAINVGVQAAKGELFFILDSDDILPANSLEIVNEEYSHISERHDLSGLCGLDSYFDGKVIGTGLPQDRMISDNIELRHQYCVTGDMKEVFKTSVMREFPFPEIDGERFCSEDLIWNRISSKYRMMYINKIIYCAEYQAGGITSNIIKVRMDSPIASTTYYSELEGMSIPFWQKVKASINYWRFWFCLKDKNCSKKLDTKYIPLLPIGFMMHCIDKRKLRK